MNEIEELECQNCGKNLTGRQRKFCGQNCQKEMWHTENRAHINAYSKKWRHENFERIKAYLKSWHKKNPEKANLYNKKWQKKNPEYMKVWREMKKQNKK